MQEDIGVKKIAELCVNANKANSADVKSHAAD
jgi:hypothetical protein